MTVSHRAADMAGAKMIEAATGSSCMPSRGDPREFVIRSCLHGCERRDLALLAPLLGVLANPFPIPHGHNQVSIGPMHHARVPAMILQQQGWILA